MIALACLMWIPCANEVNAQGMGTKGVNFARKVAKNEQCITQSTNNSCREDYTHHRDDSNILLEEGRENELETKTGIVNANRKTKRGKRDNEGKWRERRHGLDVH